jgi:hypothetical protein
MWNRTLDLLVGVITGVAILSVLHGWEADDSVTFTKEEPTCSTRTIKVGERLDTVIAVPGRYRHRYRYTPAPGPELKMEEFGERNGLQRELTTADFCRGPSCDKTEIPRFGSTDWFWVYHYWGVAAMIEDSVALDQAVPWIVCPLQAEVVRHALQKIFPSCNTTEVPFQLQFRFLRAGLAHALVLATQFGQPLFDAKGVPIHVKHNRLVQLECWETKPTGHPLVWDFRNACSRYTMSVVVGVGEAHKMPANQTNSIHRARPFGRYTYDALISSVTTKSNKLQ